MRSAILTTLLLSACAIGDGRGFATIDGTLTIDLREDEFVTPDGREGTLDAVEVGLVTVELFGDTVLETGTEHRSTTLPVPGAWDPIAAATPTAFGPLEVDRGDYAFMRVTLGRIVVSATADGTDYRIEVAPEGGTQIVVEADLPVNDRRPPNITIQATLTLPKTLMEGVDIDDKDLAAEQIRAAITNSAVIDATWVRKSD